MKIFLDTIDLDQIKKYDACGIINGVTTNPSLMSVSKHSFEKMVKDMYAAMKRDVSVEVAATDYDGMVAEGEKIIKIVRSNIVIKLPITCDGLKACKYFCR